MRFGDAKRALKFPMPTMDGEAPKNLLRDRDDKYGPSFGRAAKGAGRCSTTWS